jgi:hypothetical protein
MEIIMNSKWNNNEQSNSLIFNFEFVIIIKEGKI